MPALILLHVTDCEILDTDNLRNCTIVKPVFQQELDLLVLFTCDCLQSDYGVVMLE